MFRQLLTPVAGSLPLSFLVAAVPIAVVLVLLGVARRPAWQASLAGLRRRFRHRDRRLELPARLAVSAVSTARCSRCGR